MNAGPVIFLVAMLALLWFLLIRPQRQRQVAHRELIAELQPDQEVVTVGGLYGTIREIADEHVTLEVAPSTRVRIAKPAISGIVRRDG